MSLEAPDQVPLAGGAYPRCQSRVVLTACGDHAVLNVSALHQDVCITVAVAVDPDDLRALIASAHECLEAISGPPAVPDPEGGDRP